MHIRFRQANEADIAELSAIRGSVTENVLSDPSKITPQLYCDYLQRQGRGWLCEVDGRGAGFSCADQENASIWALFVRPEYEGMGVGKGLLTLAADFLFNLGHEHIVLATAADTRADRFYAAQGWIRGAMKNQIEVTYSLSAHQE